MLISIRDIKGTTLYARFRRSDGKYWNNTAWVTTDEVAGRTALTEHADADPRESLFTVEVTPPMICVVEVVRQLTGEVIGSETTHMDAVASGVETLLDIGQGKWEIVNQQMVLYTRGGTELMVFDLKDKFGSPTDVGAYQRIPV